MSDSLTTKVDRSYLDDATRADASRYLIRTNNADLLVILGLAVEPKRKRPRAEPPEPAEKAPTRGYRVVRGRMVCAVCARPVRVDGVCRQRNCGGAR